MKTLQLLIRAGCGVVLALQTVTLHAEVTPRILHDFGVDSSFPVGLLEASNGWFYGTANTGGANSQGTIFRISADGAEYQIVRHFDSTASYPSSSLIEASDGYLYGTTLYGGGGAGTVYRILPDGTGFSILRNLDGTTDGSWPNAAVTEGSDGYLYGTTTQGGTYGYGTVFRLSKSGSHFEVLRHFDDDAFNAYSPVIEASDGLLYGTTRSGPRDGGNAGAGTIYRMSKDGSFMEVIHTFDWSSGTNPYYARLLEGPDGKLYGTTWQGGPYGTIYRIAKDGTGFETIKSFSNYNLEGAYLSSGVTLADDGYLYGATYLGGANGDGTIFRVMPDGSSFEVLYQLDEYASYSNQHELVQSTNGMIYGLASQGGPTNSGGVFRFDPSQGDLEIILSLGERNAGNPNSGLIDGMDGYFYGTTRWSGGTGYGAIYKVLPDGSDLQVIHRFNSHNGSEPNQLMLSADGYLYGTTYSGGNAGTVFRIKRDGSDFESLKTFSWNEAYYTYSNLVEDAEGWLYGTSLHGPSGDTYSTSNIIFRLKKDGSDFEIIKTLSGADGHTMYSGLLLGSDGKLYGLTYSGGLYGAGVAFSMERDGSNYTVLKDFDWTSGTSESTGAYPRGRLIEGIDGYLYGYAHTGGEWNHGTLFKLSRNGAHFEMLYPFKAGEWQPHGTPLLGSDGRLYGITTGNGSEGGIAFRVNSDGSEFTVLATNLIDNYSWWAESGQLLESQDGSFYGTSAQGGLFDRGFIFTLDDVALDTPFKVTVIPGIGPVVTGFRQAPYLDPHIPPPDENRLLEFSSLLLDDGSHFELGIFETLLLTDGPLTVGVGAVLSGNGLIDGSVINWGLVRIPLKLIGGYVPQIISKRGSHTSFTYVHRWEVITCEDCGGFGYGEPIHHGEPIVLETAHVEGTYAIDASLEITGSYTQTDTGKLRVFVSGDIPGVTYSQLIVGEEVMLDGELQIVLDPTFLTEHYLEPAYFPAPGDTFDFITSKIDILTEETFTVRTFAFSKDAQLFADRGETLLPYDSGIAVDPDNLVAFDRELFNWEVLLEEPEPGEEGASRVVLRATFLGFQSEGSTGPSLESVVSRKAHGQSVYDIGLMTVGEPALENRAGDLWLVFTFSESIESALASVTGGTGNAAATFISGNAVIVQISNAPSAQTLEVTLNTITAVSGGELEEARAQVSLLVGELTGDGRVNVADTLASKKAEGQIVTAANFRNDVNADGVIDADDTLLVKDQSGKAIP